MPIKLLNALKGDLTVNIYMQVLKTDCCFTSPFTMFLTRNDFPLVTLSGCDTDLLDDSFEPPLRTHQCDCCNDFSMKHAQSPVLQHIHTNTHKKITIQTQ